VEDERAENAADEKLTDDELDAEIEKERERSKAARAQEASKCVSEEARLERLRRLRIWRDIGRRVA
jgi:hypothetical protein